MPYQSNTFQHKILIFQAMLSYYQFTRVMKVSLIFWFSLIFFSKLEIKITLQILSASTILKLVRSQLHMLNQKCGSTNRPHMAIGIKAVMPSPLTSFFQLLPQWLDLIYHTIELFFTQLSPCLTVLWFRTATDFTWHATCPLLGFTWFCQIQGHPSLMSPRRYLGDGDW